MLLYFHWKSTFTLKIETASSATILSLQIICFRVLNYILYAFSRLLHKALDRSPEAKPHIYKKMYCALAII